jgi:hypothetical protein
MSKTTYYRQCRLQRGNCHQVSWIPEPYCVKDKVLKLKNSDGVWENGWVVKGAGTNRITDVPHAEGLIRAHRKATGDSLPKGPNN